MSETSNRALVTGGAGFLGPHLTERLLRRGWRVLALDNLFNGRAEHLAPFVSHPGFSFAQGDITAPDFLAQAVGDFQPDTVFHLAALHFIPYCIAHPADTLRTNVLGTQLLLDAIESTPLQSFIFASSADVYAPSDYPHLEDQAQAATNIYGASKIVGEQLLRLAEVRCPRARFFSARFSNLVGPGETNPHVLPDILTAIRRGPVLTLGNLQPRRDYIYVGDVAEALVTMAAYSGDHRVFNVSTGQGSSVLDLVRLLEGLLGHELRIEVDAAKVRRIERMSLVLDNSRAKRELDWSPRVSLEESIRLTLTKGLCNLDAPSSSPCGALAEPRRAEVNLRAGGAQKHEWERRFLGI